MGRESNIEWTDSTWNFIRGCTPASPGCQNCYAANLAGRFSKPGQAFEGLVRINAAGERTNEWNGEIAWVESKLLDPLKWGRVKIPPASWSSPATTRPRRIFVNSVSDVGHPGVTDEQLDQMHAVIALAPGNVFQILTKRPHRLVEYYQTGPMARVREAMVGFRAMGINLKRKGFPVFEWSGFPMPNVILGCSVENQEWADKRREPMAQLAAAGWNTMVSYEPALDVVDWRGWEFLRWLVSGGESQAGSRPSHINCHRAARDFCIGNGIAYFFKQWGDWIFTGRQDDRYSGAPDPDWHRWPDGEWSTWVGKERAGSALDGRQHKEFPEGL